MLRCLIKISSYFAYLLSYSLPFLSRLIYELQLRLFNETSPINLELRSCVLFN